MDLNLEMTSQPSMESLVGAGEELAEFVEEGFGRKLLVSTDQMKVVLAAFKAGQEIPPHAPMANMVVSVLSGDGKIRIGQQVHDVRAGDVAIVPAGEVRGILAGPTGMVTLHIASPPPTAADHAPASPDLAWPQPNGGGAGLGETVRDEHAGLRPTLEGLGELADTIAGLEPAVRSRRLGAVLDFLRDELLPHAAAEESTLYPAAERVLRARGGAVRTMTLGHEAIADMIEQLESAVNAGEVESLPGILHSLRAIVLLHLQEEEEVYLPALAGLSETEATDLATTLGLIDRDHQPHHH